MGEASWTCEQTSFLDILNATSLPASAGGLTPLGSQDGQRADRFGPARVPAHHSVALERKSCAPNAQGSQSRTRSKLESLLASTVDMNGLQICGTSTLSSTASLRSASLSASLENRLRQQMGVYGSPEYVLRWKHWDMLLGQPICALRASGRRTSDNGCGGWPTPNTMDTIDRKGLRPSRIATGRTGGYIGEVLAAGWRTPQAGDATKTSWADPSKAAKRIEDRKQPYLGDQAQIAGWATPASRDYKSENATPQFNEKRWAHPRGKPLSAHASIAHGPTTSGCPAPTAKRGGLNPGLPRWLMGFPAAWGCCGATAMQLCRRSPRNLSKPT